jgi:hypothetical protein
LLADWHDGAPLRDVRSHKNSVRASQGRSWKGPCGRLLVIWGILVRWSDGLPALARYRGVLPVLLLEGAVRGGVTGLLTVVTGPVGYCCCHQGAFDQVVGVVGDAWVG